MRLDDFSFNELLPESIKNDPKFKAAARCLDAEFKKTNERVKDLLIYSRIDELDEKTLDDLAWQFRMDYFEGYGQTEKIEDKRELIKIAITQKWYKGTRYSLERAADILELPIEIVEWWEEDKVASGLPLKPYEFEVFIDTKNIGLNQKFYPDVFRLINALKNVRSHLKRVRALIDMSNKKYLHNGFFGAIKGRVLPDIPTSFDYGEERFSVDYLDGSVLDYKWDV